ncbi:hypothetical protein NMY22_g6769 [Coprinellus aureogranulatus]|nr:hypothetical protein NMY22_g6769 [Coprinellus aureogranulatus]
MLARNAPRFTALGTSSHPQNSTLAHIQQCSYSTPNDSSSSSSPTTKPREWSSSSLPSPKRVLSGHIPPTAWDLFPERVAKLNRNFFREERKLWQAQRAREALTGEADFFTTNQALRKRVRSRFTYPRCPALLSMPQAKPPPPEDGQ